MKRSFIVAMCLWGAVAAGCGSDNSGSATTVSTNSEAIATLKLIDPPVSSNDVSTDITGTRFIMVANSQGKSSNISTSSVVLQSSYTLGSETVATFETLNGMKVGSAYSGTPVFTADGKMAWVLYAGYQGVPNVFIARDINAMLPLFDENSWGVFPPRIAKAVTGTEMKTPWWSRGLDSRFSSDYQGPVLNEVIFVEGFTAGAAKSGALASSTTDELSPGSTIAVNVVTGDVVSLYATGTLSYTKDGKRWLAFGHSLDQSGISNLPVSKAFTNSTIDAGARGTFKDSYPLGPNIGTLVYDSNKGVVIDTDKVPETTPVTVMITMDGRSMTWTHNVARDNGSWLEYYGLNAAVSGPLYTLNNLTGSYSYSGTVTIGVDGSATEDIVVNNDEQISYGYYSYDAPTLEQVISHLRYNVTAKLSDKGIEGKSFNIVSVDVTITKHDPSLPATQGTDFPAAPVNTAAIAGVKSLTVSWDPVGNATSYNLYYSTSPSMTPATGNKVAAVSSPYMLAGLTSNTPYYVVITAVKENTEGMVSSQIVGTPQRVSTLIGPQALGTNITTDKHGNLYSVGNTSEAFDGNTKTGLRDIILVKFDIGGNKKWSRQIGAANAYSISSDVVVDNAGYIYVTGTTGGDFDGNIKAGNTDLFLLKYDSDGNKIWSRQMGAVGADIETPSIAVDKAGVLFVSGTTNASLAGESITGIKDFFIARYDANGNMLWLQMHGVVNQYSNLVSSASDDSGNVLLAGSSCGGFEGTPATGLCDLLLLKFDTNGNKSWSQMVGAVGEYTDVKSVAVDSTGSSYVTGFTGGNFDGITKPAWGDNMFLTKFDTNGYRQWSRLLSGGFYAYGNAVAVDRNGNAYVTGDTGNPFDGNSAIGQKDVFVVKYDTNGNKKWSKQLGVIYSSTTAGGITTDGIGDNNVYIVGGASGDVLTHVPITSYYDSNFFMVGIDTETGEY